MLRYARNMQMLTAEENTRLKDFKVCVIGCGGLGGYVIEMLGRLGIGYITAVDGDVFEESNLNRQILSDAESLGMSKAFAAKERMAKVNPLITLNPVRARFDSVNGCQIIGGHDVVIDALDNLESRLLLEDLSEDAGIPLVHGAIAGWFGQVTTILPGDRTLKKLYPEGINHGIEKELGNPSFTPALVASIQVSEVLKLLIKRGSVLSGRLLMINLLEQQFEIIDLV
ncbi:MAG: HesA/MoeB/ThiF family protein [Caulobacteraceae bacterium]